ncbi:hypothetical protein GGF37_006654, partial [Kickxella alabastrina]
QNFVDFGAVPLRARAVRRIALANLCACPVALELAPSDARSITAYTPVRLDDAAAARAVAQRLPQLERQAEMHSTLERFRERQPPRQADAGEGARRLHSLAPDMFVDKAVERRHVCLVPFARAAAPKSPVGYLDAAVAQGPVAARPRPAAAAVVRIRDGLPPAAAGPAPKPGSAEPSVAATIARAHRILDEITQHLDMVPQTLFASAGAEDEYVRRQVDLRNYVGLLVEAGFLRPAARLTLPAAAKVPVVVMLCPDAAPDDSALRLDANLYFTLVNRPASLLPFTSARAAAPPAGAIASLGSSYQLPVRRFLLQASLRRSELEIGQKSINVGNMQVDEACSKYLVIQNRAEDALMYAIRKTGSIASGDIRFVDSNRYGVVRAFDSRKIGFVFSPSLTGVYNEQISIANVVDPQGARTATLKAVVRRPTKFYIKTLGLRFAPQPCAEPGRRSSDLQLLVVKNMTAKTRRLV